MTTLICHAALALALIGSSGCVPSQQAETTGAALADTSDYRVPEQTGDGWRTASLADQDIDTAPVVEMLERIRAGEYTGISSVLLARGGALVLEEYFGEYSRNNLHSTRSSASPSTGATSNQPTYHSSHTSRSTKARSRTGTSGSGTSRSPMSLA